MLEKHLHRRVGFEHELSGQRVVCDAAERINIRSPIDARFAQDNLRRHVGRRARRSLIGRHKGLEPLLRCLAVHFHKSEVQHLHEVVFEAHPAHVNIRGFDIAVHETARMRVRERVADLPQQEAGPRCWNRSELAHQRLEIAAHQQLHDVKEGAVVSASEIEHLNGVR